MMANHSPPQHPIFGGTVANVSEAYEEESKILKKIKDNPALPIATVGTFGIVGYRLYRARQPGGFRMSLFLIHTRLAAQGFGVAALGSLVLYSLGERFYKAYIKKEDSTNV